MKSRRMASRTPRSRTFARGFARDWCECRLDLICHFGSRVAAVAYHGLRSAVAIVHRDPVHWFVHAAGASDPVREREETLGIDGAFRPFPPIGGETAPLTALHAYRSQRRCRKKKIRRAATSA